MQAPSQIGPPAAAILDSHSGGVNRAVRNR